MWESAFSKQMGEEHSDKSDTSLFISKYKTQHKLFTQSSYQLTVFKNASQNTYHQFCRHPEAAGAEVYQWDELVAK